MTANTPFHSAFGTDIGRRRSQNQDHGAARPELGLFLVADGMGGHRGGETASALAVEIVSDVVSQKIGDRRRSKVTPKEILKEAIETANGRIYKTSAQQSELQGMGTTTTALLFDAATVTIGHVGDSRCYLIRADGIWQLTRDHSLVQEKLRAGLISREQLKTDRLKNVITRSVGFEPHVQVETYEMKTHPQDTFLLCSDGLSGLVEDRELLREVQTGVFENKDLPGTVQRLIDLANEVGGDDNITVVLVQVSK